MTQLLGKILRIILAVYVFVFAYQWWKPAPEFMLKDPVVYNVPEAGVHFLADTTFTDKEGMRQVDQYIWDQIFKTIKGAKHAIVLDMFLYNDFQGEAPETTRPLSRELTDAILAKKAEDKHMAITLITDPINSVYEGVTSLHFLELRLSGVLVIMTNIADMPDSNLYWSSFWHPFFSWFGNSDAGGLLPHPFQYGGAKVSLRSWAALLNFKANHRKLLVADEPTIRAGKVVSQKIVTIVTSSNPHDASSAHGNVALKVDDHLWQDAIVGEGAIAKFSGSSLLLSNVGAVNDISGTLRASLLHEQFIKTKARELIDGAKQNDHIDLIMFYLSDRDIIKSLILAANRGVQIRIILDPNKDAFGFKKNGIPNQPVAKELINRSNENINIRWCDTHGEQCHAKMMLGSSATSSYMMLGSANFTRRNIDGLNLEADILVQGGSPFAAWKDANKYFEKLWSNTNASYTVNYETYKDNTFWKGSLYRIMEATGMSSF